MIKKQFLRFIVVGLLSTAVSYGVFLIALHYFYLHYLAASALGFFSGVIVGFFCNKSWTFEASQHKHQEIIIQYFLVYLVSLFISMVCLKILVDFWRLSPELANFLVIGVTTCTNFIGVKFLVFKK